MKRSLGSLLVFLLTLITAVASVSFIVVEHFGAIVSFLSRAKETIISHLPAFSR